METWMERCRCCAKRWEQKPVSKIGTGIHFRIGNSIRFPSGKTSGNSSKTWHEFLLIEDVSHLINQSSAKHNKFSLTAKTKIECITQVQKTQNSICCWYLFCFQVNQVIWRKSRLNWSTSFNSHKFCWPTFNLFGLQCKTCVKFFIYYSLVITNNLT